MKRVQRVAIISMLVDSLHECGSWCGETHIQKSTFFLQDLLKTPLGYDFILYKHGPFSFDLRDEMTAMRADNFLVIKPQPVPYGPKLKTTENACALRKQLPRTMAAYNDQIEFVAEHVGKKCVAELEGIATSLYVSKELGMSASLSDRISRLLKIKQHFSEVEAREYVKTFDEIARKAQPIAQRG